MKFRYWLFSVFLVVSAWGVNAWFQYHKNTRADFYQLFAGEYVQVIDPTMDVFDVHSKMKVMQGSLLLDGKVHVVAQIARQGDSKNDFIVGFEDGGFLTLVNKGPIFTQFGSDEQRMWIRQEQYRKRITTDGTD